jgi:hypothetical protein
MFAAWQDWRANSQQAQGAAGHTIVTKLCRIDESAAPEQIFVDRKWRFTGSNRHRACEGEF